MAETTRSRFQKVLAGALPDDRLPVIEWASWWDQTLRRWEGEGLPAGLDKSAVKRYFGLDMDYQLWVPQMRPGVPSPGHGQGYIRDAADYEALRPMLYPDPVPFDRAWLRACASEQAAGDAVIWFSLEGFFWWPRVLLGIEAHLYAFYDQPELMHRICADQVAYLHRCLDEILAICTPDFMTFAEDMSYNHGPMIGKALFEEFMTPYYLQVTPRLHAAGVAVFIDSDGGIEPLIPWFQAAGIQGILPLERMAGVDVARIRAQHPAWLMLGGYDKTVMHLGEEALHAEFARLLPTMRRGGFIPSVDHQTPPGVSLADYQRYVALLKHYAAQACQ